MEIKVPSVGESVFEVLVAKWHKQDGAQVSKDEPVCEMKQTRLPWKSMRRWLASCGSKSRKERR